MADRGRGICRKFGSKKSAKSQFCPQKYYTIIFLKRAPSQFLPQQHVLTKMFFLASFEQALKRNNFEKKGQKSTI